MIKTLKGVLIEQGMSPDENPPVICPCGRETVADMCVDLTPLPLEYRQALGLEHVDYIADCCQTRLFRDRHVSEDEFYALLGQDNVDALFEHNRREAEWKQGRDERHEIHRPRHQKVTAQRARDAKRDMQVLMGDASPIIVPVSASIPLRHRVLKHEHVVEQLRRRDL